MSKPFEYGSMLRTTSEHHDNGYNYGKGMEFEVEDYATAEEADSGDGYGYYYGSNQGGFNNVEVREDHVELVKSKEQMDSRTIPTKAEVAEHIASESMGFGDDIELDEADYSAKDGTFEIYGTKGGLRFAATVQVLAVERTDF